MAEMTPIFGIDLGTTYSCIARIDQYGQPQIVPNAEGDLTTPSVVYFNGEERVVGKEAKAISIVEKASVKETVKRDIGRTNIAFVYNERDYSPEEVSAFILRKLVQDAAQATSYPSIEDVVITCPAYFGFTEREATKTAGELAGLNVRDIINEPTAAALAYGINAKEDQVLLVYDLGGGTFDITMIEVKGDTFNVIVTGGERLLGGKDWDSAIVNYLAQCWQDEHGPDSSILDDLNTLQSLYERAESAKMALTASTTTNVAVRHMGKSSKVVLTREKFDELTASLLNRTILHTQDVLDKAKKKGYPTFDKFLLVGGSSRMPQVKAKIKEMFGVDSLMSEPDFLVAKGAAIYGQMLALGDELCRTISAMTGKPAEDIVPAEMPAEVVNRAAAQVAANTGYTLGYVKSAGDTQINNITSHSFGVIALRVEPGKPERELVRNLIQVNDSIPTQITQTFGTHEDRQLVVDIRIVENEVMDIEAEVTQSAELGIYHLELPANLNLPRGSDIEVTLELDRSGLLNVVGLEPRSGTIIQGHIQTNRVMSKESVAEAKQHGSALQVR